MVVEREGENRFFECASNHLKASAFKFNKEVCENYFFIYFHEFFIRDYLKNNFLEKIQSKKIIIICTSKMQSLAKFYLHHFTNVLAIIDASKSVQFIINEVRDIHGDKIPCREGDNSCGELTMYEFNMLVMMLDGNSIQYIARRLNVPIKTAYGHSHVIAKKMGVRKVHDLIIAR